MTMQTATLQNSAEPSFALSHRTTHLGMAVMALVGLASIAPSTMMMTVVAVALSLGLAAWSVVRVIRADSEGLTMKPSLVEKVAGAVLIAVMIALANVAAASMLGAPVGFVQSVVFGATMLTSLAVVATLETVTSALVCYALKRFAATGSIGAEIAVMLNLQQKFATSLDGVTR